MHSFILHTWLYPTHHHPQYLHLLFKTTKGKEKKQNKKKLSVYLTTLLEVCVCVCVYVWVNESSARKQNKTGRVKEREGKKNTRTSQYLSVCLYLIQLYSKLHNYNYYATRKKNCVLDCVFIINNTQLNTLTSKLKSLVCMHSHVYKHIYISLIKVYLYWNNTVNNSKWAHK